MSGCSRAVRALVALGLVLQVIAFGPASVYATASADPAFQRTWERTDKPVDDLVVNRTWIWGPEPFSEGIAEPYVQGDDASRLVQYFDKSRMEITDPGAVDDGLWYVTNGLLVVELITGELQLGHDSFLSLAPADVPVAGDPNDPTGPTYATFTERLDDVPAATGSVLTQRIDRGSNVTDDTSLAGRGVTVALVDEVTQHAIAEPFWSFMTSTGPVQIDGQIVEAPLFDSPYYATGRPITEPYWATVRVAGTPLDVLLQCFERRCLTYTPTNPAGWQTEMGNVGLHYFAWRNGGHVYDSASVTPAAGGDVSIEGATVTIEGGNVADNAVVSIAPTDAPAPNGSEVPVSGAFDIQLHGADLTGSAALTFSYDPSLIPDGVTSDDLFVAYYDDASARWQSLPTIIDPSASTATVVTDHLSIWQVFSPAGPGSEPGDNVRPTLDLNGSAGGTGTTTNFTAGDAPVDLAPAVTITDPDDTQLESARLQLSERPDGSSERLAVDTAETGISASYVTSTGELLLTGSAPIADYEAVLATATYQNTASNPTTGSRNIRVTVNDGDLDSNVAIAQVNVRDGSTGPGPGPGKNAPVAFDQSVTVAEDGSVDITLTGMDADDDTLTFELLSQPAHGTLSGTAPNLTYVPDGNYHGPDAFTFQVGDGIFTSNIATISIDVMPVNDAPVANSQRLTTTEDTPIRVTLTATDLDGDPLTYTIVEQPAFGRLSGSAPNLTYTPNDDFDGIDHLTFVANDGQVDSNVATITITVGSTNDGPVANDQSVDVDEDASVDITLTASDPDGDTLSFNVVDQPDHGTLTGTAPNLTYTPDPNFHGSDAFTFQASDGDETSNIATVSITVRPVNDAPAASDQSVTVLEDTATTITLTGSDIDGDDLTYAVINQPFNGTLTGTAPNLTYTPNSAFTGSDSFTFHVNDGSLDSDIATISITIVAVNDAPTFTPGADVTVLEDSGAFSAAWATGMSAGPADEAGQVMHFEATVTSGASLFSVAPAVAADGTLTFTPAADAFGSATVDVVLVDDGGTANGGDDTSDVQQLTITITPVNDAPSFIKGIDVEVNEDSGPQTFSPWAAAISAGPANESSQAVTFDVTDNSNPALFSAGPTVNQAGGLSFTPAADANGSATITLRITDDGGTADSGVDASAPQTFTITINAVNDAPSFVSGGDVSVTENSGSYSQSWASAISSGPSDESGQSVQFAITSNSNAGLFSTQPAVSPNGILTFAPATDANGSATITVVLNDDGGSANGGDDTSDEVTFVIYVTPVNHAPSFTPGASVTFAEDSGAYSAAWATNISAGPPDESGQSLQFDVTDITNPSLFSVTPAIDATGVLTFTPVANANGTALITLVLKDDGGTADGGIDTSGPETFTITVTPVNDAPSFVGSGDVTVLEDSGLYQATWATSITPGPADESGQTVEFTITGNSNPGLFSVQPALTSLGTLSFTPAPDASGSATMTVILTDNGGTANSGDDTSDVVTFVINVTAVNEPPVLDLNGPDAGMSYESSFTPGSTTIASADATITDNDSPDFDGGSLSVEVTGNGNDGDRLFVYSPSNTVIVTGTSPRTVSVDGVVIGTYPGTGTGAPGSPLVFSLNENATPERVAILLASIHYDNETHMETATRTVTVTLVDGDGTAAPGADDTGTATATIIFNQPPVASDQSVSVNEDVATTITLTGSDPDNSGTLQYRIRSLPVNGRLYVGSDTTTQITAPQLPYLLPSNGAQVTYLGNQDFNGSDSFAFSTFDGSSESASNAQVSITVNAVNDAPTFTKGGDQTILEDAAAQTITGWATGISAGASNESDQLLTFVVTSNNNSLFSAQPAIAANGTLTYTPAADAFGSAIVSVRLDDSGPQGGSNVHQSATQTFTISVTPVNDAPSFAVNMIVYSEEDAGPVSIDDWASFDPGPNETTQTATYTVSNIQLSTHMAFTTEPVVSPDGTLTYTPAPNAHGTATFNVVVTDSGDTENGGVNTSGVQTFTMTIGPVNDAPVIPGGSTKTYEATAHLEVTVTQDRLFGATDVANEVTEGSVLSARTGSAPDSPLLTTGAELATSRGGKVIFTADGFRYQPPATVTGGEPDTASYYICDTGYLEPGLCTQLTLSFGITGELAWFIDGSASTNGNGTMYAPFNSIANFNTYNAANSTVTAGDVVFLYSGTYTDGITLVAGQRLFGQGGGASNSFTSATGLSAPAAGSSYPSLNDDPPNIDAPVNMYAVTLSTNNSLRYLWLGKDGARAEAGITGTTFGTLTVDSVSIVTDKEALKLSNGTLATFSGQTLFNQIHSNGGVNNIALTNVGTAGTYSLGGGSLAGASGDAVIIDGQSGSFSYAGVIRNNTTLAVRIQNKSGGTVTFSGTINQTPNVSDAPIPNSGGILINNNSGTITFSGAQTKINSGASTGVSITGGIATVQFTGGGLKIVTTTGNGFHATAGTVRVTGTGNTIASTGGIALNVNGATIGADGLTFESISANGGVNGIVLNGTGATAGLTVQGTGSAGSGGTIQNTTSGASISNASNIQLNWMNFTNANTSDGAGTCDGLTSTGCNGAIRLMNVTSVAINRISITGTTTQQGIVGATVTNVTIANSTISDAGNEQWEHGIRLFDISGANNAITGTTITNAGSFNIFVQNSASTPNAKLTISGSTIANPGSAGQSDGITIATRSVGYLKAVVQNNAFTTSRTATDGIQVDSGGSSTVETVISGNDITGYNTSVNVSTASTATTRFDILNNPRLQSVAGQGVNVASNGSGTIEGQVVNNTITTTSTNNCCMGIDVVVDQGGDAEVLIQGNSISGAWLAGVRAGARNANGRADITLVNNNVTAGGAFPYAGLFLFSGNGSPGESSTTCVNFGTPNNNFVNQSTASFDSDIILEQFSGNTFQIQGLSVSGNNETLVEGYVSGLDVGGARVEVNTTGHVGYSPGVCQTPTVPSP